MIGSFGKLIGPQFAWMGAFVGFVSTAIMFYFSVVNGWCLRYLATALSGGLEGLTETRAQRLWNDFIQGYQPVLFHLLSMSIGTWILYRGVVKGIERANRLLVPTLLVLLLILLVRAVTLPGGHPGIETFFTIRWELLLDYRIWLDALTQNAWSTGAGWGLILTYAVYMGRREDTVLNSIITAFANHSIFLISGILVFATVYALTPPQPREVMTEPGPMNTGLTFIWIPQLFARLPAPSLFCLVFLCLTSCLHEFSDCYDRAWGAVAQ